MILQSIRTSLWQFKTDLWLKACKHFLLVFNWHQVTPQLNPLIHQRATWTSLSDFQAHLDYLTARFRILPLREALARIKQGDISGPCAALTFDDGDISVLQYVLPILTKRQLPATFFINTAYIELHESYWFPILEYFRVEREAAHTNGFSAQLEIDALRLRTTGDPTFYDSVRRSVERFATIVPKLDQRLVTNEWLSALDGEQFTLGSHGHEHQRFAMMPAEWQLQDLNQNLRILSGFKAFLPIFGVPFGCSWDWTAETLAIAGKLHLDVATADGGINVPEGLGWVLRRISCDGRKAKQLVLSARKSETQNALKE